AIALVGAAFVSAWFWNPPYGFSPEDNLAYRDYVLLHEDGERFLEARYPMARVLTAWPASDELTRPWLGYVTRPVQVVRIEDFSLEQVLSAAEFRDHFEIALVFSTKYEPRHTLLERWNLWTEWKRRFFGFHRDLPRANSDPHWRAHSAPDQRSLEHHGGAFSCYATHHRAALRAHCIDNAIESIFKSSKLSDGLLHRGHHDFVGRTLRDDAPRVE